MSFTIPNASLQNLPEPPAMVHTAMREDVMWDRPVFKAPPLEVQLPAFDASRFAEDLRRIGLVYR